MLNYGLGTVTGGVTAVAGGVTAVAGGVAGGIGTGVGTVGSMIGVDMSLALGKKRSTESESSVWKRMKKEFMEEMRYLSKLRHPCITTVSNGTILFLFIYAPACSPIALPRSFLGNGYALVAL